MAAVALARMTGTTEVTGLDGDQADRALLRRVATRRDAAAFERLYHHYRSRLGPFIFRIVRDPGLNEEVFNDVMLAVWRGADKFNGKAKVSTWIFAIAYRQCLKRLRGARHHEELSDEHIAESDATGQIERGDLVARALAGLSPEHRLVVELAYFQGNNYQEIAAIADCPENTVKTRMFYARRKLRDIMADLGEAPQTQGA